MTAKVQKNNNTNNKPLAYEILHELYQNIDEIFLSYFISLAAPRAWRPHLEKYEKDYRKNLREDEVADGEIESLLAEKDHIFSEGEFQVQTKTKQIRKILMPGSFENIQAKNTIKIVYDSWESSYRPRLEKFVGEKIQSDIWGDLGYLRQSIAHRNSKGIDKLKNAKLIKDFITGQEIVLSSTTMGKIGKELEKWYTEFLMKYFSSESIGKK